jgi:hypothetical protein
MPPFDLTPYRPVALDDLVRVGRAHDGGYVISRRTVDAARVLVGLGINDDWSFEEAFVAANPGVRVVGVDGSVSAQVFRRRAGRHLVGALRGLVRGRRSVLLTEMRDAVHDHAVARSLSRFFDGRRHHFVPCYFEPSDSPTSVSWPTLAERFGVLGSGGCDVFLKMDIEGAEYRTLEGVLRDAHRLAGVAIEFHDLDRDWDRFAALMEALMRTFAVAHLHGNNCVPLIGGTATPAVLEVSLVNRALLGAEARPSTHAYPIPGLDMPNAATLADYPLAL